MVVHQLYNGVTSPCHHGRHCNVRVLTAQCLCASYPLRLCEPQHPVFVGRLCRVQHISNGASWCCKHLSSDREHFRQTPSGFVRCPLKVLARSLVLERDILERLQCGCMSLLKVRELVHLRCLFEARWCEEAMVRMDDGHEHLANV